MVRNLEIKLCYTNSRNSITASRDIERKVNLLCPEFFVIVDAPNLVIPTDYNMASFTSPNNLRTSIFIKNCVRYKQFNINGFSTLLSCTLMNINIAIIAFYAPWKLNVPNFKNLLDESYNKAVLFRPDIIIFTGDFNASTGRQHNTNSCNKGEILKSWCRSNGFSLPDESLDNWTFKDSLSRRHIIDHMIFQAKVESNKSDTTFFELEGSDHRLMFTSLNTSKRTVYVPKLVMNFIIPSEVLEEDDCCLTTLENIEKSLYSIKKIKVGTQRPSVDCVSRNILKLLKQSPSSNFNDFPPQMRQLISKAETQLSSAAKKNQLFMEAIESFKAKKNPWPIIKSVTGCARFRQIIADTEPAMFIRQIDNVEEMKESFREEFVINEQVCLSRTKSIITKEEVKRIMSKKESKIIIAPPARFYLNEFVINHVVNAVSSAYLNGYFPKKWAIGKVSFIPKKDSQKCRVIVVQHPVGMVLQSMIFDYLAQRLEDMEGMELEEQHGFLPGKGVQSAIYTFHNMVMRMYSLELVIIDIDIAGAFDNVPWEVILSLLEQLEVADNIKNLVMTYLRNFTMWII